MSCQEKVKPRCKKVYSACVVYEKELPEFSTLDECVTIEETTEELYELVGDVREQIDLSTLESECLTLPTELNVNTMFQHLITTICSMQETIAEQGALIATMQTEIEELQENTCP